MGFFDSCRLINFFPCVYVKVRYENFHCSVIVDNMEEDCVLLENLRKGVHSTGIAKIISSSITGSDIHYRMLATMMLLTFLLNCCVMTQQEGIMQDVYTFAGTNQCQLSEYGPYSYICKSIY